MSDEMPARFHVAVRWALAGIILLAMGFVIVEDIDRGEYAKAAWWSLAFVVLFLVVFFWPQVFPPPEPATIGEHDLRDSAVQPQESIETPKDESAVPSALALFYSDFEGLEGAAFTGLADAPTPKGPQRIFVRLYVQIVAHSKFLVFCVPGLTDQLEAACSYMLEQYPAFLKVPVSITARGLGELSSTDAQGIPFSGRIYIYHEGYLEAEQVGRLTQSFKDLGVHVQFRGAPYSLDVHSAVKAGQIPRMPEYEIVDGRPRQVGKAPEKGEELVDGQFTMAPKTSKRFSTKLPIQPVAKKQEKDSD
jgi:hypothetical protein